MAKLWREFLSVFELIASHRLRGRSCDNKCGLWQKFVFAITAMPFEQRVLQSAQFPLVRLMRYEVVPHTYNRPIRRIDACFVDVNYVCVGDAEKLFAGTNDGLFVVRAVAV